MSWHLQDAALHRSLCNLSTRQSVQALPPRMSIMLGLNRACHTFLPSLPFCRPLPCASL